MSFVIGATQLDNGKWHGWWRWNDPKACRRTVLGEWPTEADALDVARYAAEDNANPQQRLVKPPTAKQAIQPWIREARKRRKQEAAKEATEKDCNGRGKRAEQ